MARNQMYSLCNEFDYNIDTDRTYTDSTDADGTDRNSTDAGVTNSNITDSNGTDSNNTNTEHTNTEINHNISQQSKDLSDTDLCHTDPTTNSNKVADESLKICIVFGSSSKTGSTYTLARTIFPNFDLMLLKDKKIAYFDYQNNYENDEFADCIKQLLDYDIIVLASPVYWYSITAQMKTFLDRIIDLIYFDKPTLELMRKKHFAYISTYAAEPGFAKDIILKSLNYLRFPCLGYLEKKQNEINEAECNAFYEKICAEFRKSIAESMPEKK